MNPFNVAPNNCEVTYACTTVVRLDKSIASDIKCSDLIFDGVFDGGFNDGVSIFNADLNDYLS